MKAAVLGHPVSHSLSPLLHNAAYQELGLDISYSAIETTREQLAERIGQLDNDYVG
ncbi:MAG: shikimate dehydrogenase, partial [Actinomycetia bacterium]|nr:shikimate dehydrogenase [Actinomycetes bacterium]